MNNHYDAELAVLFDRWKGLHESEKNTAADNKSPENKISKKNFIPDGIIDEACYEQSKKKILFIAKEAACLSMDKTAEENFLLAQNDGFWCRKVAFGEEKVSPFSIKLALLANALMTGNFEDPNTDIDILKYVAFMNLNKRGGFTKCHRGILRDYVQKYRDLIEEEIKIISPDIIVCCGVGIRDDLLKKYVHIPDENVPVLEVYHPSYAVSYEKFLNKLKTEFEAIK